MLAKMIDMYFVTAIAASEYEYMIGKDR